MNSSYMETIDIHSNLTEIMNIRFKLKCIGAKILDISKISHKKLCCCFSVGVSDIWILLVIGYMCV